ncbi:MAG: radical SAM protein [Planctomycetota bacterium]
MNPLTAEILAARGFRNVVEPWQPYHFLVEPEVSRFRRLEDVTTVFLSNRECPFRCVFCDLWKNTLDYDTPLGAIPAQIDFALSRLPATRHIKLYNSGNFFDSKAIPTEDWPRISEQVQAFSTVIVENHPRLCSIACGQFQQLIGTQLEVAMGLETSHEETLRAMNKQMTTKDFASACELLQRQNIMIRAFVLLKPPDTSEEQAIDRAIESVRFAINCGADCVSVIPVRTGNGWLDQQYRLGRFQPPRLSSLEVVLRECLSWRRARVFADLWDVRQFADDVASADVQIARLNAMNVSQTADL